MNEVVNRAKEDSPGSAIKITIDDNFPLVKLDYGLMEQALQNLVRNAVQSIPKHCIITVGAWLEGDKLILVVEDNGNGFPPAKIAYVFDKFYRLKTSVAGGIGLGLSIVKGFVEAHDGTIFLQNVPDGGARFTIEITTEISRLISIEDK